MQTLIDLFSNWLIIVQGALGSALFWVLLQIGIRITAFINKQFGVFSTKYRKILLLESKAKYLYQSTDDVTTKSWLASALLHRAFRNFLRGILWLIFGLIADKFLAILGIVGYIGCIYYMFLALNTVKEIGDTENLTEKIHDIDEMLRKIDSREK